jgi:hypothetical protein
VMRKKVLFLGIVTALVAGSLPFDASAAVKAGSNCSKAGTRSTNGGKIFTCVKSGRKLVWDKGVAAVSAQSDRVNQSTEGVNEGNPCLNVGESIKNTKGLLECREVADGKKRYFQLSNKVSDIPFQKSPESITTCRIADQRATQPKDDNYAIAYPIQWSPLKRVGSNKVLFLPFDFSDHPGGSTPTEVIGKNIETFKNWVKYYSNGKFSVDVETTEKWIRASQPSEAYAPYLGHANPNNKIGFEMLMRDSENLFDYSNIDAVFIYFPPNLKTFKTESTYKSAPVKTNKGIINIGIFAVGQTLYNGKSELWFWLTHEILHSWGIKQHAPAWPAVLSVNTGSPGPGQSLITWDSMILDWINEDQIWCAEATSLSRTEVTLSPLEREQNGVKAVMIKLSPSRVLVIESHRKDRWGNFLSGTYGVTAYLVDTRFDTDRSCEYAGTDDFKGKQCTRAANYLEFDLQHGDYRGERFDYMTGKSWGIQPLFSKNYFLYQGESFSFEGIKVTLSNSGDNDTLILEKVK